MKNRSLVVFTTIILFLFLLLLTSFTYKNNDKKNYSLDELKNLLKLTNKLIICPYNIENPNIICSEKEIIKIISDKTKIEQIISILSSSERSKGTSNAMGAGTVLHALDEKGKLILNIFYYPYLGLKKDSSFYVLNYEDREEIMQLIG